MLVAHSSPRTRRADTFFLTGKPKTRNGPPYLTRQPADKAPLASARPRRQAQCLASPCLGVPRLASASSTRCLKDRERERLCPSSALSGANLCVPSPGHGLVNQAACGPHRRDIPSKSAQSPGRAIFAPGCLRKLPAASTVQALCCYTSVSPDDVLIGCRGEDELLCVHTRYCLASGDKAFPVSLECSPEEIMRNRGGTVCELSLAAAALKVKMPSTLYRHHDRFFCLRSAGAFPLQDPVPTPVCAFCCCRVLPRPMGPLAPPLGGKPTTNLIMRR